MDPGAAIKKIGDELKAQFDSAGMGSVEALSDKLEEIKTLAEKGPGDLVEKLQETLKEIAGKMEAAAKDPASMAPAGGMAAFADWHGSSVAGKLTAIGEETKGILETVVKLGSNIGDPLKTLAQVLGSAMKELETSLKALSKLPAEVTALGGTVKGPADVAKIDTAPMMKATDTSPIEAILTKILGLKEVLGPAVEAAKAAVEKLAAFIMMAPDLIRGAFDVPMPLCFLTSCLHSQAPEAMTKLLEMVEKLKLIDLQPMLTMLTDTADTILGLDLAKVKEPLEKFGAAAKEQVGALDKLVKAAAGAGVMAGKLGGFGK